MNSQLLPSGAPRGHWHQIQDQHQLSFSEPPGEPWPNGYGSQRFPAFTHPQHQFSSQQAQPEGAALSGSAPANYPQSTAFPSSSSNPLVGITFDASKSPSVANILQPEERNPEIQDEQPSSKKRRRPRGQVHPRINQSDWDKYRDYLKHLYIGKQLTAPKIREHMKQKFQFDASEQQYKNKFVEWGFLKKIPKDGLPEDVLQWVVVKNEERARVGKKTEFIYENRTLPSDRIQQIGRSARFQRDMIAPNAPSPIGLTYSTPAAFENVPSPFHANTVSPYPSANMSPPDKTHPRDQPAQSFHLGMKWKGYNRVELEDLVLNAREMSDLGNLEQAEENYRDALAGLEHVLSATNERTLSVGYEIAEFFAKSNRMDEADGVLSWMTDKIVEAWGIRHTKSVTHFLQVTDLYHGWSRPNDAMTLLLQAVNYLEDPPVTKEVSRVEDLNDDESPIRPQRLTVMHRFIHAPNSGVHKDQPHSLEFQLVVANAQARTKDEEAEPVLLNLIEQCEKFPNQFTVENFKAHAALIQLYYDLEKHDALRPVLKNAGHLFYATMKSREALPPGPLVSAAIRLAEAFISVRRQKTAATMLDIIEAAIPDMVENGATDKAIDILVEIGGVYQAHDKWKYARPKFEHALAVTLATSGPQSNMALRLQDGLDNEYFSSYSGTS
ncbi:hypothetical protein BGZ57DRAFT_949593 [Hyaloscypha finlandica]|nr:hypothetical protein BGZ57DRAFT_949593 [Hyaloscypha finlandica]